MKDLIIVESPTKANTLTKFLGKEYKVISTMGHIRDLPPSKLGIEIVKKSDKTYDFIPQYIPLIKKKEVIKKLKEEVEKAKKVYLASVDYDESILIRFPDGLVRLVKVGAFIDKAFKRQINPSYYQVPAFDFIDQKIRFKSLKEVSRHLVSEDLLEVVLDYGRKIKITASHSVFSKDEEGEIKLVKGAKLQQGDKLLVPLCLPCSGSKINKIDLLREVFFHPRLSRQVFINSPLVSIYRRNKTLVHREGNLPQFQYRVSIDRHLRQTLVIERQKRGWSQRILADKMGCSQTSICDWEKGNVIPTLPLAKKYFACLDFDLDKKFKKRQAKLLPSSLETVITDALNNQWRDSRKSLNRTYQPLRWFSWKELENNFGDDKDLKISRNNHSHLMPRFIPVNRDLMLFLGFFIAEGSFLDKGKYLRFSFGKKDLGGENQNVACVKEICQRLFNLKAGEFEEGSSRTLVVKSTLVSFLIREVLGVKGKAGTKKVPDIVFNVSWSLQQVFLEGLFLGDGSLGENRIVFNTVSSQLSDGIRFLLLQNGVITSYSTAFSKKANRKPLHQIVVSGKKRLKKLKPIWGRHYKKEKLQSYLVEKNPKDFSLIKDSKGDLGLLRIRFIRKIKPTKKFVYDFSVKGENFICGNGGICAHNTDPDREGEAISYHVAAICSKKGEKDAKFSRITFHEITKRAIKEALGKAGKINFELVNAQQTRRLLDRLVGYKLSPLLWRKIRRGLSAGRVQTVAVRLIVEREREREKFIPEEYWDIFAHLRKTIGGKKEGAPTFFAKLVKKNGDLFKINEGAQSEEAVKDLENANYEVAEVERKEALQNPPAPFTTSTLQQTAFRRLGFSGKRTMRAAQSLYEKGLITYHRTDSFSLSIQAIGKIRDYIKQEKGENYLPESPRIYKTRSKVAQEAHEAVRPTNVSFQAEEGKTGRDEYRLYKIIWQRAVASQMKSAIWDQAKINIQAANQKDLYGFLVEGKVIKFDGWLSLYGSKEKEEELPDLKKGDDLDLIKIENEQKFTLPPAQYTEASLVKALEGKGIGRPSTYVPIISTIQTRQYVEKEEGKFKSTPLGEVVNDFLIEYFPNTFDYQFTAKMEDELDDIANGKIKWISLMNEFYIPFEKKLEAVAEVAKRVQVPTEATGEDCPECKEGQLVIRVGRFGKFISCSRFPDCKYTAHYVQILEGFKCADCGGDVVVRKTKKGKQFYGCSNYPKCKWASWNKPKK